MPDLIICKCGRVIGPKPHCIKCGSTNIYNTKSYDRSMMMDGEMVNDRAFHCRACGSSFRESMECAAPLTKDAARIKNDYPVSGNESRRSVSEARRMQEKLKDHTIRRILHGQRLLTQDEEDDFRKRYGESLSETVNMPIVEGPDVHETSVEVMQELGLKYPDTDDPFKTGT